MADTPEDFERALMQETPRGIPGEPGTLVEAQWLTEDELLGDKWWSYRNDDNEMAGVLFGYRGVGGVDKGFGTADSRHILTVASSRSGKGVMIISNLLLYEGSVIAIDPKGELARETARARREMGQKVVILDPYKANGHYDSGSYNPLDELDPKSDDVKDEAGAIADALVEANEREPHWTDNARYLIRSLILFALTLSPKERNLIAVWQLASLAHPRVRTLALDKGIARQKALFELMKACKEFDGSVEAAGERFSNLADRELASIMSTTLTQLQFLDGKKMPPVLQTSDFRLADLKTGKTTVYLSLPATRMGTHSRWLRVIINLALVAFEREATKPKIPVLMVLDEFNVLGKMETVEKAAGLVAGFGVKLWIILQDLGQLKHHYKGSWGTFVGNAGIAAFWANSDKETIDYISDRLGQTSLRVQQPSGATPGARLGGASATRDELRVQRLLSADEAARYLAVETRRALVLGAGRRPVILKRPIYYKDEPFKGKFGP